MSDVTRILAAVRAGEEGASDRLLATVYAELRRLAAQRLARERGDSLEPTALVHEAYLRLAGGERDWSSRAYFFGACAQAMRRILVDRARRRARLRHGGRFERRELFEDALRVDPADVELLALDEALRKLERDAPEKAELVELHHFAGLSLEDTARALGISKATAERRWAFARAFLYHEVKKGDTRP
jgi:RNA polymerase sigma factor (TIGR02999 family)